MQLVDNKHCIVLYKKGLVINHTKTIFQTLLKIKSFMKV